MGLERARALSELPPGQRDAVGVLREVDAGVVGDDPVGAELGERRAVENHVQLAAMDADLRMRIAGALAARLPVDQLAEPVEEAALGVLDAGRQRVPQLQAHVAERLASFKVPSRVLLSEAPLPRNPAGKILKRDLRESLIA